MSATVDNPHHVWNQALQAVRALAPYLSATIDHYRAQTGMQGWGWSSLISLLAQEPRAMTTALMLELWPYDNPQRFLPHLRLGVELGYVLLQDDGYRLTVRGRRETQEYIDDLRTVMAAFDPLSLAEGGELASSLARVVGNVSDLVSDPPPSRFARSYTLMPAAMPPLPFIEQAISCLAALRDDLHIAAWQPSGLSGPAVEALTYLWRGQADSLDSLHRQLVRRHHPKAVYRDALAECHRRGYVTAGDTNLIVTDAGNTFRQRVEEETDRAFYAPWQSLHGEELTTMHQSLLKLARALAGEGLPSPQDS